MERIDVTRLIRDKRGRQTPLTLSPQPKQIALLPFQRRHVKAYLYFHMSHEDRKAGQVGAGAGGVCAIGGQQPAVLRRPESRHGALGVAPERAVGIEILFRMLREGGKETRDTAIRMHPRQNGPI